MLISKTARKYTLNTQYVLNNERQKMTQNCDASLVVKLSGVASSC